MNRQGPLLWFLKFGGDDLDLVAHLQLGVNRREFFVDIRADAMISEVGVDVVSEIEHCRAFRQRHFVAVRSEDKDLVVEEVELETINKLYR